MFCRYRSKKDRPASVSGYPPSDKSMTATAARSVSKPGLARWLLPRLRTNKPHLRAGLGWSFQREAGAPPYLCRRRGRVECQSFSAVRRRASRVGRQGSSRQRGAPALRRSSEKRRLERARCSVPKLSRGESGTMTRRCRLALFCRGTRLRRPELKGSGP